LNGTTNPAFNVDASTASSGTGINIKSSSNSSGVAISVLSGTANEGLTLDAKGSGNINIGSVSTGTMLFGASNKMTITTAGAVAMAGNLNLTGGLTINSNIITFPGVAATLASLNIADQTLTGGANVTSQSQSTGNITVDCGSRPLQYITNNGAWTITAPSNDGSCMLLVTNGASAATPTITGFTVGSSTGDALDNVSTHKFTITVWRINGVSSYLIKALQ
jgi:hypothetical protein